jgi:hypothetical protein
VFGQQLKELKPVALSATRRLATSTPSSSTKAMS